MLRPRCFTFQNLISNIRGKIEFLFYWTISQIIFVALGVFLIIGVNYFKGGFYRYEKTVPYYEVIWTSIPTLILCSVALPRICLLYTHEQEINTALSIKCIGHQWYWRYEYSNFNNVELDRFITPTENLEIGETRYLEVDNRLIIPLKIGINFFIRREDVIHAWTIPVLGVKVDATPGRLNVINLSLEISGVLYGQCRELCGANHRFMPIVIETTTITLFKEWLSTW